MTVLRRPEELSSLKMSQSGGGYWWVSRKTGHETVSMFWHICVLLFHVFLLHAHNTNTAELAAVAVTALRWKWPRGSASGYTGKFKPLLPPVCERNCEIKTFSTKKKPHIKIINIKTSSKETFKADSYPL